MGGIEMMYIIRWFPKFQKNSLTKKVLFGRFRCFGGSACYLYVNDPEIENFQQCTYYHQK
jgi:hypothetical protein